MSWNSSAPGASSPVLDPGCAVEAFEGGRRYEAGSLPVLALHGTFLQMGRQYGHLLKTPLNQLYQEAVVDYFMGRKGIPPEVMRETALSLFRFYPRRFRDILAGMAQTSGLSLDAHILLNAIELYGMIPGCSAMAAWGDYTGGDPLVVGRNYDWYDSYARFARRLAVAVFNPDSGIPAATVTFAGVIYATTGINARGLFLELNNGLPSGGEMLHANRVPTIVYLLGFLFDYATMEQLDAAFNSTRSNFAFIINTADRDRAWSYEWPPFDLRRRGGDEPGLLVSTNHFVDPAWGLVINENIGFQSVSRYRNLLELGREYRGGIDPAGMMRIMDTPMERGGATWPDNGGIRTVYQIVAVPERRELHIKVPGWQEWAAVGLTGLFAPPTARGNSFGSIPGFART